MSRAKSILVVDDERSIVESLVEILTWEGYTVLSAGDGRAGLTVLGQTRTDLILLDYMMPVMNGLDMLRTLRGDPLLATIPVVMMTAAPIAKQDGATLWDAFLRKPFELDALFALVRRFAPLGNPPT